MKELLIKDVRTPSNFTTAHLNDKQLMVQMLQYEDSIIHSEFGQDIYRNKFNESLTSLTPQRIIQRIVLKHFGFTNTEVDIELYRQVFKTYYKSPTNYDADIMSAVTYLRENLCLYYTTSPLVIGDVVPNVNIYSIHDVSTMVDLYSILENQNDEKRIDNRINYTMICSFSSS